MDDQNESPISWTTVTKDCAVTAGGLWLAYLACGTDGVVVCAYIIGLCVLGVLLALMVVSGGNFDDDLFS